MPCYSDWEYSDYGNHGNEYNEYNEYSDHAEPDHSYQEPDYNNYEYEGHTYEDYGPEGGESEHGEDEDEGNEVRELWELEHERDQVHEHRELAYDDDEMRELEELERMANEEGYEPQTPEYHHSGALGTNGHEYEHDDAHTFTPANNDVVELLAPPNTYSRPTYVPPTPFSFTPTPIPHAHDSLNSNQRGHVTALDNRASNDEQDDDEHAFTNVDNDVVEHLVDYPVATSPPSYTYLKDLRRDYSIGIPSAVAYMQGLREYTAECPHEPEEWKADRPAELRQDPNTTYPNRDRFARPRSWAATDNEDGLPRIIEGSRPLGPGLKRRRYRNARTPHYRTSQPRPQPEPKPPDPDRDDDTTSHTPPATTVFPKGHPSIPMFEGGHPGNNGLDRFTHRSNPNPKTHFASQGHPQTRNKYYYGTHTATYTTPKQRPPPWPIISPPNPIPSTNPH